MTGPADNPAASSGSSAPRRQLLTRPPVPVGPDLPLLSARRLFLVFVGAKMALTDLYKVPVVASLGAIAAILVASIVASIIKTARDEKARLAAVPAVPASQL
mgnify:CR=1 FL=1